MLKICPYPKFRAYDSAGAPLSGGKLYTYEPGTATPKAAYSDADLTVAQTNPVILDTNGEADIYLNAEYKLILKDADDVTVWTADDMAAYAYEADLGGDVATHEATYDHSSLSSDPTFDTVTFTQIGALGSKTTDFSVDFSTDQNQSVTLTANTMTITLDTTSIGIGGYTLYITNGGLATETWAAETGALYWAGGTAPTLTSSGVDVVVFKYDGTNFYGVASLDFS